MKKWTWILLTLSVGMALFLWSVRENFQDTATLKGPPYGDSDYPLIVNLMSYGLVKKLQDKYVTDNPGQGKPDRGTLEGQRKLVDGLISGFMGDFHRTVYKPATTPLTEANVDTFLNARSFGFYSANKDDLKKLLVAYFVNQPAGAPNTPPTAAQNTSASQAINSGYAAALAAIGQSSSGGTGGPADPLNTSAGSSGGVSSAGGSGNIKKGNIWGPADTGFGTGISSGLESGSRDYPTLLGPEPKESKMVEGGGIANISQNKSLVSSGALPNSRSTGSDPNSQFFGSSRVPGDQDLFPNPYLEFTPSSGSSKTEPVPYLSDFSAFLN
jgi:hypothetical protein